MIKKTKYEKLLEKKKKIHNILEAERLHEESRESLQTADGGYTKNISEDKDLETLKPDWKEKTSGMRARIKRRRKRVKERGRDLWS